VIFNDYKIELMIKEELFNKYWFGLGAIALAPSLLLNQKEVGIQLWTRDTYLKDVKCFSASWKSWLFRS
jgi:hypothetical protein